MTEGGTGEERRERMTASFHNTQAVRLRTQGGTGSRCRCTPKDAVGSPRSQRPVTTGSTSDFPHTPTPVRSTSCFRLSGYAAQFVARSFSNRLLPAPRAWLTALRRLACWSVSRGAISSRVNSSSLQGQLLQGHLLRIRPPAPNHAQPLRGFRPERRPIARARPHFHIQLADGIDACSGPKSRRILTRGR